jgi:hypothetical protein
VEDAKQRLEALKKPVPAADPAAYERQKYELDAYRKPGLWTRSTDMLKRGPDTSMAAKSGAPAMATLRPPTPVSVPASARAEEGSVTGQISQGVTDVTGSVVTKDTSAIDSKPNQLQPGAAGTPAADGKTATDAAAAPAKPAYEGPPPTNHPNLQKKKLSKKQQKAQQDAQAAAVAAAKAAAKQDNVTAIPASSAPATGNTLPSAPTNPQ